MSDRIRVSPNGGVIVEIPAELIAAAIGERMTRPGVDSLVTLEEIKDRYIAHVLACCNGNKSQAAKVLDIDRMTLIRRAAKMGL